MTPRETLLKNGLVVIDQVVRPVYRESLLRALVGVFRKYCPDAALPSVAWDSPEFHQRLIRFRQESPKLFGAMYDTLQNCVALQQMFSDAKLLQVVSDLLDEEPAGLTTTGLMLRMDPPFDERNSLAWHQESSYYIQNLGTLNGLVIWSPMLDIASEMGPVEFCLASHQSGSLQVEHKQKTDAYTSEQFRVEDSVVQRFENVAPLLKAGSLVAFTIHTIHRSGKNVSPLIRFAAGVRYHKIFALDFLPGRVQYKPNLDVGRLTSTSGTTP
jgi:ectoine hydroxylase-related dioxygenase (phytanoyl-CoA dioxygenase family)